jgi:hypothetical protein
MMKLLSKAGSPAKLANRLIDSWLCPKYTHFVPLQSGIFNRMPSEVHRSPYSAQFRRPSFWPPDISPNLRNLPSGNNMLKIREPENRKERVDNLKRICVEYFSGTR